MMLQWVKKLYAHRESQLDTYSFIENMRFLDVILRPDDEIQEDFENCLIFW